MSPPEPLFLRLSGRGGAFVLERTREGFMRTCLRDAADTHDVSIALFPNLHDAILYAAKLAAAAPDARERVVLDPGERLAELTGKLSHLFLLLDAVERAASGEDVGLSLQSLSAEFNLALDELRAALPPAGP